MNTTTTLVDSTQAFTMDGLVKAMEALQKSYPSESINPLNPIVDTSYNQMKYEPSFEFTFRPWFFGLTTPDDKAYFMPINTLLVD
jgi:hypothetical protein